MPDGELKKAGLTRFELIGDEEAEKIIPPAGDLAHLWVALAKVGICEPTEGGMRTVRWTELMHWPGARRLMECELQTMRDVSSVYADMRNAGGGADQPYEATGKDKGDQKQSPQFAES